MDEKIYIAGPYTNKDNEVVKKNVVKAITVADQIALLGFKPFVPHLFHYWNDEFKHDYEFWMEQGSEWLSVCDGLYRIPGESDGSEREIEQAKKEDEIPVFYNIADLLLYFRGSLSDRTTRNINETV